MGKNANETADTKKNTSEAACENANDAMLEKLSQLQILFEKQEKHTQKLLFWRRINSALTLVVLTVVVVVSAQVMQTLETSLDGLPVLINNTNTLVSHLNETDFDALNETLVNLDAGVNEIDFESLNEVIINLENVSERLDGVTSIFS